MQINKISHIKIADRVTPPQKQEIDRLPQQLPIPYFTAGKRSAHITVKNIRIVN